MQKDEPCLLKLWVDYHGMRFGYSNLFIYDNGSTKEYIFDILKYAENKGVQVYYNYKSYKDFKNKGMLFLELVKKIVKKQKSIFFMPLDCDEFLVLKKGESFITNAYDIQRYFENLNIDDRAYRISARFMNIPKEKNKFILNNQKKIFLSHKTHINKLTTGYHGKDIPKEKLVQTELAYLTFHNRSFDDLIFTAKMKLFKRIPDFKSSTLKAFKGKGRHLTKYLLMNEDGYIQWIEYLKKKHKVVNFDFDFDVKALGHVYPYI